MRLPSYQQLSKEQDRINNLPLDGSYLVTGPPGTGKTVIALYRAAMLTAKRQEVRVLMYSRLLFQYVSSAIDELALGQSVSTFHSWFPKFFWERYRVMPPQVERFHYDWAEVLRIANSIPDQNRKAPHLIVDEGQDLAKSFYILLQMCAPNLTVFADDNQRLSQTQSSLDDIRAYGGFPREHTHELRLNYRNTREIAELAACFHSGSETGVPDLPERRGARPVLIRHPNVGSMIDFIVAFEALNADLEIGVFVKSSRSQRGIYEELDGRTVNPVQTYVGGKGRHAPVLDFDTPGIKVVNYQSTKGLEFDVVFMPDLHSLPDVHGDPVTTMVMYVMMSRARSELYLMYSGSSQPAVLAHVPAQLFELRERS